MLDQRNATKLHEGFGATHAVPLASGQHQSHDPLIPHTRLVRVTGDISRIVETSACTSKAPALPGHGFGVGGLHRIMGDSYNPLGEVEAVSLLVNVAQLLKEPIGSRRRHHVGDRLQLTQNLDGASRVKGSVLLTRTDRGIWAMGALSATQENSCSRCLMSFDQWLELRLNEIHLPSVDIATGARLKIREEDDSEGFTIDEHHVLDLTETVRQHLVSAAPLKPLCRPDCRGLCQHCGADLNESTCPCTSDAQSVWEPLQGLLAGESGRSSSTTGS